MYPIDIASRVIHVLTAITLLGGSLFTLFVLMPATLVLDDVQHKKLREAVTKTWKRFVHIGVLLLLVSGFYNYSRAVPLHRGDGLYHALLGTKMLLALGVFFLAAAMVGRSSKLEGIRRNRKRWLTVLVAMGIAIVTISGYVKVRGVAPAELPSESTTSR